MSGGRFFGTIQRTYRIFAHSTKRWDILRQFVKTLSVKPLCETRWESRIDSVKAVRYQCGELFDALCKLSELDNDPKIRSEAQSLAKELRSFEFLVSLAVWYEVLYRINSISKLMQSPRMNLTTALDHIKEAASFFQEYRNSGFNSATIVAKELAEELQIPENDRVFSEVRFRRVRNFHDECRDQVQRLTPEEKFRIDYFNVVVDTVIQSVENRFEQVSVGA
jgi:hypothetical protein